MFIFVFSKFSSFYLIITELCDWLHIPTILAKAIGITEITHFSLNYSVYAVYPCV